MNYGGGNTLANYTYLRDVHYKVRAYFIFNPYRPDLKHDHNENKHHNIIKRALRAGGRRDIFLGARECQAYVEPMILMKRKGFYDDVRHAFWIQWFMVLIIQMKQGEIKLEVRLWNPVMKNGVIKFIKPEQCTIIRSITDMEPKIFNEENMQSVDELYE